ncbi:kininogen-like [Myxocyprinus asiaticus]|uniref:kininogen-like n=1 Tax=Myxocyprinus asiaticus TaxID=70543 RepID=UPI002222D0E7|nr:kininogen-like [Myxocyprinus asiaticus]
MMGDRILMVFTLVCLCCSGGHGQKYTSILCDDKRVENVVNLTLSKHNQLLTKGTLLALYEIWAASKIQNESGEVLFVEFTSRETDCPVGGDKVWQQCDYLQQADKVLRNCHAKVLFTEAGQELVLHDCSAEPSIVSEKAPCLGCPENIDVNGEELKEPLIHSLAKANSMINHKHFFIFKGLSSATKQVVAGFRYKLQFEMEKSNCSKSEFKAVTEECHPDQEEKIFMRCNSTVDVAPWRHESPEVHAECVRKGVSRFKRPPGWSPLRRTPTLNHPPIPKPAPKHKESSEESKESMGATQRTALNCPTKPWKEFKPIINSPAPLNTIASTQPNSNAAAE